MEHPLEASTKAEISIRQSVLLESGTGEKTCVLALVIAAGLLAFLTLKATSSVDHSSSEATVGSASSQPLDRVGGTLLDGEPIAMP